jgi:5'-3' exonuclease
MNLKRLIVDLSSVCWTALHAGRDEEFGKKVHFNGRDMVVNSATYGYENAMNMIVGAMKQFGIVPYNVILVMEGDETKIKRQNLLPCYKSKSGESHPEEAYTQFNKLKMKLVETLRNAGGCMVTQNGCEGDDIIAYLCEKLHGEKYILTGDGDLARLIGNGTHLYRQGDLDENPYGPWDVKYVTLYKALVGDSSDGIPGAFKFGDKAFLNMAVTFGDEGLDAFVNLLEKEEAHYLAHGSISGKWLNMLSEDVAEFKPLQKVVDDIPNVVRSYMAAKLHPDWVNKHPLHLTWHPGLVSKYIQDERLVPWRPGSTLVTAENYDRVIARLAPQFAASPFIALDIETSTPPESDEWLILNKGGEDDSLGVDVLGSKLTGMGITFGANSQYTIYVSVDHKDTANVTSAMARRIVEMIPKGKPVIIHNVAFELPVLYLEWGQDMMDNGFHGFIPNARDTQLMASYVDENGPTGLKKLTNLLFGYQQQTYDETTIKEGWSDELPEGGRTLGKAEEREGRMWERRQYKMNELTAQEVFGYGADDPLCTAALYWHFHKIMEIEGTLPVYEQVEVLPAYVLAKAFADGTAIDKRRLLELDAEDTLTYNKAWETVRDYLIGIGWEGTVCPKFSEITCPAIKEMHELLTGEPLKSQIRTPSKLIALLHESELDDARLLAHHLEAGDLDAINAWIESRFTGEPVLDLNSPKKMKGLLYDTMGLKVQLINPCTPTERTEKPELYRAVRRHSQIWAGDEEADPLTDNELALIKAKARTDDKSINFALLDCPTELQPVLKAIKAMKTVDTRRKMFYRPYANIQHWLDKKVHANIRQCGTVTRRPTASGPNVYQLPKKGEGVKFRQVYIPHRREGVICSIDWAGQELRLGAGLSLDPNMMACYVGDHLKDIHSITAAGAMKKKWGVEIVEELFQKYGGDLIDHDDRLYELFCRLRKALDKQIAKMADDLRKVAKNVNFGAQYDATPPTLAEQIIIPVKDAKEFLDAKMAMFPRFEDWKAEVKAALEKNGYATTMMGARRHLREQLENKATKNKALRQGPNFAIQGSGAEMAKLALSRLWQSGILHSLDMRFFAWIYDELVWSVHKDHAIASIRVIHEAMTQPYSTLPVPIIGSISLGRDFGQQIELGEEFDAEKIQAALDSIFHREEVAA